MITEKYHKGLTTGKPAGKKRGQEKRRKHGCAWAVISRRRAATIPKGMVGGTKSVERVS